jgi:hypothetical protein
MHQLANWVKGNNQSFYFQFLKMPTSGWPTKKQAADEVSLIPMEFYCHAVTFFFLNKKSYIKIPLKFWIKFSFESLQNKAVKI